MADEKENMTTEVPTSPTTTTSPDRSEFNRNMEAVLGDEPTAATPSSVSTGTEEEKPSVWGLDIPRKSSPSKTSSAGPSRVENPAWPGTGVDRVAGVLGVQRRAGAPREPGR
jgi:hypothetical protein